ncbi:hypothetical protein [Yinghuangia sp. YIM S09857]|uniref:hypothetical protein n=1 Tax=Yinghuangia sp. YIM S09857 TaxID=3436929 RepID=UPI003F5319F9
MTTGTAGGAGVADGAEKIGAAAMLRGFVSSGLLGAAVACFVVGPVTGRTGLLAVGGGLVAAVVLLLVVRKAVRRGSTPPPAGPRRALARIESRRALSSESGDIPVEFVLTVAPDDAPAYRAKFTQDINLVDIPDYRPAGIVVVEYRPDRLWKVEIVTEPDAGWARRAREESVDSAPESTLATVPAEGCGFCLLMLVGLLLGAAAVVFAFRGDLFDDDGGSGPRPATVTSTSTTMSTVRITGDAMLVPGRMRAAAEALITLMGTDKATEVGIGEDMVSVAAPKASAPGLVDSFRFRDGKAEATGPHGTRQPDGPLIDLRALPYDRLLFLVVEAKATLGLTPDTWHISVRHAAGTGALEITVTVSDSYGGASLRADAEGNVVGRSPRR